MKKLYPILLAGFLLACAFNVQATDWNTTKGWFKYQKDIDASISGYSRYAATIYYNDTLFHFITYSSGGASKIIVRKLSNHPTATKPINWTYIKEDDIKQLKNLGQAYGRWYYWPCPVIFNGKLYLFFINHNQQWAYSSYNPSDDTWATATQISMPYSPEGYLDGCQVIGDKICVVQAYQQYIRVFWTSDLTTWNTVNLSIPIGANGTIQSTLAKNYMENDVLKTKMMIGFLDNDHYARCAEINFNTSGIPVLVANNLISSEDPYTSMALIDGSVSGDPNSTGDCVQAFLRKEVQDHNTKGYRIKRCQLIEGGNWTMQEENLLPMSSPDKMWSDDDLNMAAANFSVPVPNTNNIKQYMCLLYNGASGNGLNCAWAETDNLVYDHSSDTLLVDSTDIQYLGYIEGPPPYYLNAGDTNTELVGGGYISECEIVNKVSVNHGTDAVFTVGGSVTAHGFGYKASMSYQFGQAFKSETGITITKTITRDPSNPPFGDYLVMRPVITQYKYWLVDAHGNQIYPCYHYTFSDAKYKQVSEKGLRDHSLVPSDPKTYLNRCIKSQKFNQLGLPLEMSWGSAGGETQAIDIDTSSQITNTHKVEISAQRAGLIFKVKFEGSFELNMTTSTNKAFTGSFTTHLRSAVYPLDLIGLDYTAYFLKRTPGKNNWWLHPGQDTTSNTWCLTYEVTEVDLNNGQIFRSSPCPVVPEDDPPFGDTIHGTQGITAAEGGFFLAQNYPNPVESVTKFRYSVGKDDQATGNQGLFTKLVVYNLGGNQVAVLVNEQKTPGNYEVTWDASKFAPGIYIYSMESGNFRNTKKLVLLK